MKVDSYSVGYFAGKCCARLIKCAGVVKIVRSGFRFVSKTASVHKIDSSNVAIVSNNLFDCLPFVD